MKLDRKTIRLATASATALLGSGLLFPGLAAAQESPEDWSFRATLYGYFPDIGGKTAFPAGAGSEINISSDDLISNTELVSMAAFEVQKGRWGSFVDVIYMDIGNSKPGTSSLQIGGGVQLPPGITADVSLDIEAWVVTLAATYRAIATPRSSLDVFAGTRLLSAEGELGYAFNTDFGPFSGPARLGSSETARDFWDGVAGVKGQVNFGANSNWFARYYADVGTGDSDLTWQGIAGVGYAFGRGEVIAAWRHLDYAFKSDSMIDSLDFDGPAVGVTFRW
jgi:hypothetical protein